MKALAIGYLVAAPVVVLAFVLTPASSDMLLCIGGLMLLTMGAGWVLSILALTARPPAHG